MISRIIDYIKKNVKLLIFILIFCISVFLYNQNLQTLNFVLKRGVVLEYSVPKNININKDEIKNKLDSLNIKYSFINISDKSDYKVLDWENKPVEQTLVIGLTILAREDKKPVFDSISDFIFEKYASSRLIDIKSLNNYSKPYAGFFNFLIVLTSSGIIWLLLMYIIFGFNSINQKISQSLRDYFENKKEKLRVFINKTREKGIPYFIKRLLSDDDKDCEDTSLTKEIVSTVVFVLVAVILIRYFIGELRWIPSGSMRTTIVERDRVYVEKIHSGSEIKRGDIIVFYPPSTELLNTPMAIFTRLSGIFCKDIAYIKRVVGLPGEKLEIKQDKETSGYRVFINDKPLYEPYTGCYSEKMSLSYPESDTEWTQCLDNMFCGPFIIPQNSYFMMGDNRCNSADSRFWGFLDKNRIIGRATFMFWPIKRINVLKDKYIDLHKNKDESEIFMLNRYGY